MKNLLKYIPLAIILVFALEPLSAQSDTLIVTKESESLVERDMDRLYKLFVADKHKEVNHLWKVNLVDIGFLSPNIGYEQRIIKFITSETYLNLDYVHNKHYPKEFDLEFEEQLKFYYNFNRRVKRGKRIGGLSGNYISIGGLSSYTRTNYSYPIDVNGFTIYNSSITRYGGQMKIGLQRRVGNIGYIDLYGGVQYVESKFQSLYYIGLPPMSPSPSYRREFKFILGIRAGFAIDSYKNLKRMLK